MLYSEADSHYFVTNDNVKLHYIDKGQGQVIVMLPSWSLSTAIFRYQIHDLSRNYRVIALDMRGHGQSEKVEYGYKIYRLAKDLHELLHTLKINNTVLLGHAVGASIILCYWELFGAEHLQKMILLDRAATPLSNPKWSKEQIKSFGPTSDAATVMQLYNQISSLGGEYYQRVLLNYMLSKSISDKDKQQVHDCSAGLPNKSAASLFYDNYHQDWRTMLPNITIPTLVITGRGSPISLSSQTWLSQQIKDAKLVIFEENEGGKHFPFIENPHKFNQIVDSFIQTPSYA
ncbi:alpha/beta fold hydrolase [Shewanella surugensis]|uniref:Alpha/beta hydrolase n=1 Tax=Shewanella surugensis TaxID=212020 RepID=A0ABT0LJX2_9GAMM|nr:alpha/beta hydrolase [Shewanella surugensis]MCL1128023.1 alpha/beta hydrolase [Shewanella surugensis]